MADLSFIESIIAPGSEQPQQPDADPGIDLVEELLSRLETPEPVQAPKVGPFRQVIGSLGDALSAQAAVRAGGAPPAMGQFRSGLLARELAAQEQNIGAAAEARNLRNRVRIGQFLGRAKSTRAIEDERNALIAEVKRRGFNLTDDEERVFLLTGKLPSAEESDDVSDLLKMAQIGEKGATLPEDIDPHRVSAAASIRAREESDEPDFAGFRTEAGLENALRQIANKIVENSKTPKQFETIRFDPITRQEIEQTELRMIPQITFEEAFRQAMEFIPGSSAFFTIPTAKPKEPVLTLEDVREELRSRGAAGQ
jgi:hypothetical protein